MNNEEMILYTYCKSEKYEANARISPNTPQLMYTHLNDLFRNLPEDY